MVAQQELLPNQASGSLFVHFLPGLESKGRCVNFPIFAASRMKYLLLYKHTRYMRVFCFPLCIY